MGSDHIIINGATGRNHLHHHHHQATWVYPTNPIRAAAGCFNPTQRWGHSSCYYNQLIYVFGGCCGGMHFSDVVALDLETMCWTPILTTGETPGPRDSHTAVLIAHKMVIFGGTTGFNKVNHLHILDLKSKVWTKPICGGVIPSPRESHTATVISHDKLVVFGGSGEGEANYLSDLHILDLKTMIWVSPKVNGDVPVPRDSHSAVVVVVGTTNKIYVYGGDCGDRYQSDVHVLDIQTFTWFKLAIRGPWPGPRAGHAAFAIGSKMYVIGGVGNKRYYNDVWVLDTNVGSWTRLEISGRQPQGRFSHTAVVVANSDIVIYGGCGEDEHPLSELVVVKTLSGCYCVEKRKMNDFVIRNCEDSKKMMMRRRRRRAGSKCNSKIVEIESESESEAEEHSVSLNSQQSSPASQSDREQTPLKNMISSQIRHKKQSSSTMHFVQNSAPHPHHHHINFLHETQSRTKTVQHFRARLGRQDYQSMNGTEVRGKIDGCFDSGYLMTATVNGRAYRGVLFAPPPPPPITCTTNMSLSNNNNNSNINYSPTPNLPECGDQIFMRQPNQVTGTSISSSMAVREPKIRNDLKGVVLTLGGAGACTTHAET